MINQLKNIFQKKTKSKHNIDPMFDLPDWHQLKEPFDKFKNIICKHLDKRDNMSSEELRENHPEHELTEMWVYKMCEEIHKTMENDKIEITDIMFCDTWCSGHVDYLKKFALRLAELEAEVPMNQIYR